MNDDELLARLRAADPARRDARAADASTMAASWIDDLTEATMNETREPTETPSRPRRWLPAAATAAVLAAIGITLAVGGGDGDAPPAAQPGTTLTLGLAADDAAASCIGVSVETLRPMEVAFSGTATAVEEKAVTITPDRWYKGGNGATAVRLTTMGPEMVALLGNVQFEEGKRYLITATNSQVNACGFSAEWSPEMAAMFEQAFG
jgi:hypothetical protein